VSALGVIWASLSCHTGKVGGSRGDGGHTIIGDMKESGDLPTSVDLGADGWDCNSQTAHTMLPNRDIAITSFQLNISARPRA